MLQKQKTNYENESMSAKSFKEQSVALKALAKEGFDDLASYAKEQWRVGRVVAVPPEISFRISFLIAKGNDEALDMRKQWCRS